MPFFALLALGAGLSFVAYLLMPKPQPPSVEPQDFNAPDARADKPMPIIFGTKRITAVNCIGTAEKSTKKRDA